MTDFDKATLDKLLEGVDHNNPQSMQRFRSMAADAASRRDYRIMCRLQRPT